MTLVTAKHLQSMRSSWRELKNWSETNWTRCRRIPLADAADRYLDIIPDTPKCRNLRSFGLTLAFKRDLVRFNQLVP